MQDQAAGVADIGEMGEQPHALHQPDAGLVAALHAEGEHRRRRRAAGISAPARGTGCRAARHRTPRPPAHAPCRNSATRCALATWRSMRSGSVSMPVMVRNAFIGAMVGPKSRKRHRARLGGEGEVAEILEEVQAVIGRLRRPARPGKLPVAPVEFSRLHHHAAERVAVAAEKFRGRVADDVGPPLDRPAQIGRGQRVIDDQRNAGVMRHRGDRLDVHHHAAGIGQAFDEDRLAARRQRAAEILRVGRIDEMAGPAEPRKRQAELGQRPAIQIARGEEFVARLQQREEGEELRRHGPRPPPPPPARLPAPPPAPPAPKRSGWRRANTDGRSCAG